MDTERSKVKETAWYPLRVVYGRERKLLALIALRHADMETFLPMRRIARPKGGTLLVPAVRNLLFVRAAAEAVEALRREAADECPFCYLVDRERRCPITVDAAQMERFRRVAGQAAADEAGEVEYLDASLARLKRGSRVRITGGLWAGLEGELIRLRGKRRVLITVPGLLSVATAAVSPALLELVDE